MNSEKNDSEVILQDIAQWKNGLENKKLLRIQF